MGKSRDLIRQFASLNLKPTTDLESFVGALDSPSMGYIVRIDDTLRIEKAGFRFASRTAAMRMCDHLKDFFKSRNRSVLIFHEE